MNSENFGTYSRQTDIKKLSRFNIEQKSYATQIMVLILKSLQFNLFVQIVCLVVQNNLRSTIIYLQFALFYQYLGGLQRKKITKYLYPQNADVPTPTQLASASLHRRYYTQTSTSSQHNPATWPNTAPMRCIQKQNRTIKIEYTSNNY